jgi:hypothetical protein
MKLCHSQENGRNWRSFTGKWEELEIIMLSEISQTQKDKGFMYSLICGIWCKYCVHMYVNGRMIPIETISGMGGGGCEGEWWRG